MPTEKPVFVPAATIDEVISRLEILIETCIAKKDRNGYFAALYHRVTSQVRDGIKKKEFESGSRMEKLDVVFANRYLEALHQHVHGEKPSGSWQTAFDAAKKRSTLVLQHLLLGINAHINLDLGVAAVETAGDIDIHTTRNDFNNINNILAALIFEVMTEINRVSPLLSLFGFHATNPSILIQFSISNARDGAWCFAEELTNKKHTAAYTQCVTTRDNTIAKLGQSLLEPKGLIRITMWIIHLFECKNPAKVIDVFYSYEKKWYDNK